MGGEEGEGRVKVKERAGVREEVNIPVWRYREINVTVVIFSVHRVISASYSYLERRIYPPELLD